MPKIFPIIKKITTVVSGGAANVLPRTVLGRTQSTTVVGTPNKPLVTRGASLSQSPSTLVSTETIGRRQTQLVSGTTTPTATGGLVEKSVATLVQPPTVRGARITQASYVLNAQYPASSAASTGSAWTAPTSAQGNHDAANATIAGSATAAIDGTLTMSGYPSCPNKTALTITAATLRYWYSYTAGSTVTPVSSITLAHKFGAGATVTDSTATTTSVAAGSHIDVDVTAALIAAGGFTAVNTLSATARFTANATTGATAAASVDAVELVIVANRTDTF